MTLIDLFQELETPLSLSLQNQVTSYAKRNLVKVNVYIRDPYVSKFVTEEKITRISFAGTVGGILGLFMGQWPKEFPV